MLVPHVGWLYGDRLLALAPLTAMIVTIIESIRGRHGLGSMLPDWSHNPSSVAQRTNELTATPTRMQNPTEGV